MSLKIAVVGLGRWGPNHVRNFDALSGVDVVAVVDPQEDRLQRITNHFPQAKLFTDYEDMISASEVDAVVMATPTSMHFEMVKTALEAGLHVLCEKPLTDNASEAWTLVNLAKEKELVLMTGHVFLFNAGIQYVGKAIEDNVAGDTLYLNAVRTNLGPFRSDVNAAWDLASHDIYIFNHLLGQRPEKVSAYGGTYLQKGVEDIVFLTMEYPGGVIGHIHVSWLDPKKVRQLTVVGTDKMITWDEFGHDGPVTIHDRSVIKDPDYDTFGEYQLLTREGDLIIPRITAREPLAEQAKAFADRCVSTNGGKDSRGSAKQGAEVVDVLEAASISIKEQGKAVTVNYGG